MFTALMVAVGKGEAEITDMLISAGADVNQHASEVCVIIPFLTSSSSSSSLLPTILSC